MSPDPNGDGTVRLQFHPSDMWRMADYYAATGSNNLPALVLTSPLRLHDTVDEAKVRKEALDTGNHNYRSPPVTPAQEEAITHIELSGRFLPHVILETGSLGKVMGKVRECTDQLLTEWGLDVARHKNLSVGAQPVTSPGRWLNSNDYPMHLVMRGVRGIVNFRLMVDEEGRATSCHIQQSTRPAEFDEVVCKAIMRRAKFNPARDGEGLPLPSYYNDTVRFSVSG